MDIPFDLPADRPDWNATIARWSADQNLLISMSGTLKKHPGCRHWHFKRPETAGTLELTVDPAAGKAWFSIRQGRSVGWDQEQVRRAASCLVAVALLQYFFWRSFRRRQARERKTGIRPKLTKDAQSRRGILIAVFIFCSVFFSLMALGGFVFGLGPDVQVDLDSRLDKGLNGSAIFSGWVALCGMGITVWRMKQAAKRQAAADRQTAAAMLSPPPETPDFENITE